MQIPVTRKGPSAMTPKGRNPLVAEDGSPARRATLEPSPATGHRYPDQRDIPVSRATQRDVAGYIEGLTASLRAMAQAAELDSLAYFLEMARLEASIQGDRIARSSRENGGQDR